MLDQHTSLLCVWTNTTPRNYEHCWNNMTVRQRKTNSNNSDEPMPPQTHGTGSRDLVLRRRWPLGPARETRGGACFARVSVMHRCVSSRRCTACMPMPDEVDPPPRATTPCSITQQQTTAQNHNRMYRSRLRWWTLCGTTRKAMTCTNRRISLSRCCLDCSRRRRRRRRRCLFVDRLRIMTS